MSDLEATRAHSPNAFHVSSLAVGRLRGSSAASIGPAHDGAMLDAFAEVFAQMAAANPTPLQPPAKNEDHESADAVASKEQDQPPDQQSDDQAQPAKPTEFKHDHTLGLPSLPHPETTSRGAAPDRSGKVDDPIAESTSEELPNEPVTTPDLAVFRVQTSSTATPFGGDTADRSFDKSHQAEPKDSAILPSKSSGEVAAVDSKENAGVLGEAESIQGEEVGLTTGHDPNAGDQEQRRRPAVQKNSDQRDPSRTPLASRPTEAPTQLPVSESTKPSLESVNDAGSPKLSQAPPEVRHAAAAAITGSIPNAPGGGRSSESHNAGRQNAGGRTVNGGLTVASDLAPMTKPTTPTKADQAAGGSTSDAVQRAKLVQRVAKAFQHLGPGGGVVRLRLAPAELGTVRIEMRIDGRKVNARVVAETEAASNQLRENLPDLRARLESYGMQIERLEIETESSENDGGNRFASDEQNHQRHRQSHHRNAATERTNEAVSRPVSPLAPPASSGPLNITPSAGVDLQL